MLWRAVALGLLLWGGLTGTARADHIVTAREGLGLNWWGLALAGPVPFLVVAVIAFLLYRSLGRRGASR